ncbi:MAG TPA: HI1506-related protein [Spirochaetota bacterium]|nr:HI1506-related protein [Spirochaetota bacterium]
MKVKVRSIPDTFRRAGMAFSKNPAEYDVDKKTLEILQAESQLVVEVLPEEPEKKQKEK